MNNANGENGENRGAEENTQGVQDAQNIQDAQNDAQDKKDKKDEKDKKDIEGIKDTKDIENIKDIIDIENVENVEDFKDAKDTPDIKNTKSIDIVKFFKEGFFTHNPILMQVLGTCPTLATTTSVTNGVGMGLSACAVLIFSNLLISLLRKFIPKEVRIASYVVIISGFVTALEMLLKAYISELDKSLGLFIPLIVVNCIILARAEAYASKNPPLNSVLDGLFMGLGFTFALTLLSAMREIIGAGTFAGIRVMPEAYSPALVFVLPAGAFISLGCLIALFKKINMILFTEKKEK